jgi:hypothetical protein
MSQEGSTPISPPSGVGGTGLGESWAVFDNQNAQHRHILSLCRQAQWTTPHPRHGEVADLVRLDQFLY